MKRKILYTLSLMSLVMTLTFLTACNKVIVHSKDKEFTPISKTFSSNPKETFTAAQKVLEHAGFKIVRADEDAGLIQTNWISTKATSHYLELFGKKDYGTVGAYYRMTVKLEEKTGKSQVDVFTTARAIITGRLHSDYSEEKKFLSKMADYLRKDDFEITNVGVDEKD